MASSSKKQRYDCKYNKLWEQNYSFVKPSKVGATHALCTICKLDFKITHGGANDLKYHSKTKGHFDMEKLLASNKSISTFFPSNQDMNAKVSKVVTI